MHSVVHDQNAPIEDAARERPNLPIKLRFQPTIFRGRAGYRVWKDVSWRLECANPAEAFALRDTLHLFFSTINRAGLDATRTYLATFPPSRKKEREP